MKAGQLTILECLVADGFQSLRQLQGSALEIAESAPFNGDQRIGQLKAGRILCRGEVVDDRLCNIVQNAILRYETGASVGHGNMLDRGALIEDGLVRNHTDQVLGQSQPFQCLAVSEQAAACILHAVRHNKLRKPGSIKGIVANFLDLAAFCELNAGQSFTAGEHFAADLRYAGGHFEAGEFRIGSEGLLRQFSKVTAGCEGDGSQIRVAHKGCDADLVHLGQMQFLQATALIEGCAFYSFQFRIHIEGDSTAALSHIEENIGAQTLQVRGQADLHLVLGAKYGVAGVVDNTVCRCTASTDLQQGLAVEFSLRLRIIFFENDFRQLCIGKRTVFYQSYCLGDRQFAGFGRRTVQKNGGIAFHIHFVNDTLNGGKILSAGLHIHILHCAVAVEAIVEGLVAAAQRAGAVRIVCLFQSGRQIDSGQLGSAEGVPLKRQGCCALKLEIKGLQLGAAECILVNQSNRLGNGNRSDRCLIERMMCNFFQLAAQGHLCQLAGAAGYTEGIRADLGHPAIGAHGYGSQRCLVIEGICANQGSAVRNCEFLDLGAIEHTVAGGAGHGADGQSPVAFFECDAGHTGAAVESTVTDGVHIRRNVDGGDLGALQRLIAQVGNAFRDGKCGQRCSFESAGANTGSIGR